MNKPLKIVAWILGVPVLLIVLVIICAVGAGVIADKTNFWLPDIESPPSQAVKQALADNKFYINTGSIIYETVGYQARAKEITTDNGQYTKSWYSNYFYPTLSPNQQQLAFYKTYDNCSDLVVELVLMDTGTHTYKTIFTSKESSFLDFRGRRPCAYGISGSELESARAYNPHYAVLWSADNSKLSFNFIDANYTYDVASGQLTKKDGIVQPVKTNEIACDTNSASFWESTTPCFGTQDNRFSFHYGNKTSGALNCTRYIKGVDKQTNEQFRLTVLSRRLECIE